MKTKNFWYSWLLICWQNTKVENCFSVMVLVQIESSFEVEILVLRYFSFSSELFCQQRSWVVFKKGEKNLKEVRFEAFLTDG